MINKEEVIHLLLKASLGFKPEFEQLEKEWRADLEETPYVPMGKFAYYLVNLLNRNETKDFPKIFETVEKILSEGHPLAKELITAGLLEDIQNILSHPLIEKKANDKELNEILKRGLRRNIPDDRLLEWFGPETKIAWEDLNRDWTKVMDAKSKGLI
jgi:hypothetical protein